MARNTLTYDWTVKTGHVLITDDDQKDVVGKITYLGETRVFVVALSFQFPDGTIKHREEFFTDLEAGKYFALAIWMEWCKLETIRQSKLIAEQEIAAGRA